MKRIELLAPARDLATGIVAVDCGADAVYIGAERFGAREAAGNSVEDIERLAAHAHRYYARVYVTLNTILRDDELPEALALTHRLYEAGADGLIIQDLSLLELPLPPIPLIASTQMHNATPEKVRFLEGVGFSRVILARELTLDEIREIRSQTSIELEVFVHGALCVSYSGRCYLSHAIGGRSGNRGQCAQPCRRPYQLRDSRGKIVKDFCHLLSLKDLNRSAYLRDLMEAGVTSFKIEGRLKDVPYVANIVGFYRKALDDLLDGKAFGKSSSGKSVFAFTPNPYKTFNRGYTSYGLSGEEGSPAALYTPKSLGERIGTVMRVAADHFVLAEPHDLVGGDGICFFDDAQHLCGTTIHRVQNGKVYPAKMEGVKKGTVIYRNHDHLFLKRLSGKSAERFIGIAMTIAETPGGFEVIAEDEDGNRAGFELPSEKTAAEKKTEALETVRRQLTRLGDTPFVCDEVKIDFEMPLFLPVSLLNRLRRGVCGQLIEVREANRPRRQGCIIQNDLPYPYRDLDFTENVLNEKARAFYRRHGAICREGAAESGLDMQGRRVMTARYCINKELGLCGMVEAKSGFVEPLYLVDEDGRRFRLEFDCCRCRMAIYFETHP
ncbi:MAG: U32 family peptidase [Chloroflexi bacterium]|nr:U32 family peptidase [Chloroflexota bacterium]